MYTAQGTVIAHLSPISGYASSSKHTKPAHALIGKRLARGKESAEYM
jgi:hypothetical protein